MKPGLQQPDPPRRSIAVVTNPHWGGVFIALAVPISILPFAIGFALGFTVASDVVFGLYALISGLASDAIIRYKLNIDLNILPIGPRLPFILLWVLLCIYVILFRPFE